MVYLMIIGAIVLFIIVTTLLINNIFVKANNKMKEAFSTMDIYLKKRWDLIPNIVKTVEAYAKHEKNTLKEIIETRHANYDNLSSYEKINANKKIQTDLNSVMVISEAYPELKANENFKKLADELASVKLFLSLSKVSAFCATLKSRAGLSNPIKSNAERYDSRAFRRASFFSLSKAVFASSLVARQDTPRILYGLSRKYVPALIAMALSVTISC